MGSLQVTRAHGKDSLVLKGFQDAESVCDFMPVALPFYACVRFLRCMYVRLSRKFSIRF